MGILIFHFFFVSPKNSPIFSGKNSGIKAAGETVLRWFRIM